MYTPTQRLLRSRTDKVIAGVAGGIAQYLAVDPVFVRLGLVALCFTGVGVLLYPILWLVMPQEGAYGSAPDQALSEMRQQARRVGDEIREVFVAQGSSSRRSRFDPMTGAPVDPDSDIPINNLNDTEPSPAPETAQARRNRVLGLILLGVGAFILLTMVPVVGPLVARLLIPALLIGGGVLLLRRNS